MGLRLSASVLARGREMVKAGLGVWPESLPTVCVTATSVPGSLRRGLGGAPVPAGPRGPGAAPRTGGGGFIIYVMVGHFYSFVFLITKSLAGFPETWVGC